MITFNPIDSARSVLAPNARAPVKIQVGQELKATVVSGTSSARVGGDAILRVGTGNFPVRSQISLQAGQQLNLQVVQIKPNIMLSVIPPHGSASSASPHALTTHLLQLQPKQGGLTTLLAALNLASQSSALHRAPRKVKGLIDRLVNSIASRSQIIQARGLRQAFHNSGLFLEAKLNDPRGSRHASVDRDLKANLLTLTHRLANSPSADGSGLTSRLLADASPPLPHRDARPTPQPRVQLNEAIALNPDSMQETLRQLGEAALARLTLHQISAAQHAQDGRSCWLVEIPVRWGEQLDILHLRIEAERRGTKRDKHNRWNVKLALDLPGLGALQIQVSAGEKQVSGVFWAERKSTASLLREKIPQLRHALENRGLTASTLVCREGTPAPELVESEARPLLDTRA